MADGAMLQQMAKVRWMMNKFQRKPSSTNPAFLIRPSHPFLCIPTNHEIQCLVLLIN